MKTKKMKTNKSKPVNQIEVNFYKRYLIYNEFQKIIENILFFELEEEHYEFIKDVVSCEMIADFSHYGDDIFEMDFLEYITGNKCFLCFVKFQLDEFVEYMMELYEDVA